MLMTMFLLTVVYVVFIGVLFAAGAGAGLIVIVALVLLLLQFFGSDKIAMATMGVKEVTPAAGARAARRSSNGCACRLTCPSRKWP